MMMYNPLKVISNLLWVGDPVILSLLYRSFIRSMLNYDSVFCGSTVTSHLKKKKTISRQNISLRFVTGNLRQCPTMCLQIETLTPPLHNRKNTLIENIMDL